ncbi:integrase arm-type DNA-binding domain-containing protein [Frateuria sp. Soil773]|uniref:tyrosine-type recombinase/integrase n=1 Tax=Frateuria sp. Soil773 TaxID=1736407 RepID=UPI000A9BBA8D|nr:integrase arm-type DNA-binding domain-containing protein [Frateuria sp. Soil773]
MLTEIAIKSLKPKAKVYRVPDTAGLCLEVHPNGRKHWRFRYHYARKEQMMALGPWPVLSLALARRKRDDARRLLYDGIDPVRHKREQAEARLRERDGLFPIVAKAWLAFKEGTVGSETYRKMTLVIDGDLIPALRRHSVTTLTTKDCTPVLRDIAARAPNLATKARQYLNGIVDYAIKEGLREDGKVLALRGTIPAYEKHHIAAITRPDELGPLLRAIDGYGSPTTRDALLYASWTALRPALVASAQWQHIDLDAAEWHIPGALMKMGHDHIVPLPRQAIAMLRARRAALPARQAYVFPSPARQTTPHLHRDALSKALRDMGFQGKHATHGFRGTLRTMARERLGVDIDVLEAQLAHAKRGEVQKAYDRTTFDDQRREVMQTWADYLDQRRAQVTTSTHGTATARPAADEYPPHATRLSARQGRASAAGSGRTSRPPTKSSARRESAAGSPVDRGARAGR